MQKIHRLVAIAFLKNTHNKPQVNHLDTDKKNNHISNLVWATSAENMQHAHDNGLMNLPKGENHKRSKLKTAAVIEIRNSNLSDYTLADIHGVCRATIQAIKSKRIWAHLP